MNKSILVLGGSGFVGASLVPELLRADCQVTLLNRGTKPVKGVRQISLNRYDVASMHDAAIEENFDVVIDTSSYDGDATRIAYKAFGGRNTLWLHLSSAAVYRNIGRDGAYENDDCGGAVVWGDYGREKHDAETALKAIADGPYVVLRPPYLYGPGNDNDRETFVWSRGTSGRPIIVPGTGDAVLQFLHVKDLATLLLYFVRNSPEDQLTYNAASRERISTSEWVRLLLRIARSNVELLLGSEVAPNELPRDYFPFRDTHCAVNVDRLFRETRWRPAFDLENGFASTFRNYAANDLAEISPTSDVENSILLGSKRGD